MTIEPIKLVALDPEDLAVVSAHVQDAVVRAEDIAWRKAEHRFVLALRRFDWDAPEGEPRRRLAVLHFDRVGAVRKRGLDPSASGVLNLLAVLFEPGDAPSGCVTLVFSGGGAIRLDVECIEAQLKDIGPAWEAAHRPAHDTDGDT